MAFLEHYRWSILSSDALDSVAALMYEFRKDIAVLQLLTHTRKTHTHKTLYAHKAAVDF